MVRNNYWIVSIINIISVLVILYLYLEFNSSKIWIGVIAIILSVMVYKVNKKLVSNEKFKIDYYMPNNSYKIKKVYLIWLAIFVYTIDSGILKPIFRPKATPENQKHVNEYFETVDFAESVFNVGIASPIIEEIIFRGLLLIACTSLIHLLLIKTKHIANRKINIIIYIFFIIISTVTFGVAHVINDGDYQNIAPYMASGFLYALFYLITKTLWSSILVHMINNMLNVLNQGYKLNYIPVDLACLLLFASLFYLIIATFIWTKSIKVELNNEIDKRMKKSGKNTALYEFKLAFIELAKISKRKMITKDKKR